MVKNNDKNKVEKAQNMQFSIIESVTRDLPVMVEEKVAYLIYISIQLFYNQLLMVQLILYVVMVYLVIFWMVQ